MWEDRRSSVYFWTMDQGEETVIFLVHRETKHGRSQHAGFLYQVYVGACPLICFKNLCRC